MMRQSSSMVYEHWIMEVAHGMVFQFLIAYNIPGYIHGFPQQMSANLFTRLANKYVLKKL